MKTLLLTILCLPIIGKAQVSQSLSKQFPAHIIYKIDDLVSKVKLTEDKQIKIGKKLVTADSLATIGITKNITVAQLKSFYTIDANFLKPILSPEELDAFRYENNKDNRYLTALKFATEFKLKSTQISDIRRQNDSLDHTPPLSEKEVIGLYNAKLRKILSNEQYALLVQTMYKEQSIEEAQEEWGKIQDLKLVSESDKKTEFRKIVNYCISKNGYLDLKYEKYDNNKANSIALHEPPVLIRAHILSNGIYKYNRYASIIKLEKELELSKTQIDSLLSKYIQIERIRFEHKVRKSTINSPTEYENIAQILTPEQVNKWLVFKNQDQANKVAITNWEKAKKEGLTNNVSMDTMVKDFAAYQLKYLVARDSELMYHTPETIFLKRDIEKKKPELLKQLDVINQTKSKNTTTQNALTW